MRRSQTWTTPGCTADGRSLFLRVSNRSARQVGVFGPSLGGRSVAWSALSPKPRTMGPGAMAMWDVGLAQFRSFQFAPARVEQQVTLHKIGRGTIVRPVMTACEGGQEALEQPGENGKSKAALVADRASAGSESAVAPFGPYRASPRDGSASKSSRRRPKQRVRPGGRGGGARFPLWALGLVLRSRLCSLTVHLAPIRPPLARRQDRVVTHSACRLYREAASRVDEAGVSYIRRVSSLLSPHGGLKTGSYGAHTMYTRGQAGR